jgi:predicted  nucleic acid-binding Zn ribbon protein
MDTVQLLFRTRTAKNNEELLDKVQSYLAALLHNGQIVGDYTPMAKVSRGLLVTASLPEAGALAERFANKWVRKRRRELAAVGVDRPKVTHLGADPESRAPCRCRKRPFLILFTTFMNAEPPLRCGACFGPVALYKVPATNGQGTTKTSCGGRTRIRQWTGCSLEPDPASGPLPLRQRTVDEWTRVGT